LKTNKLLINVFIGQLRFRHKITAIKLQNSTEVSKVFLATATTKLIVHNHRINAKMIIFTVDLVAYLFSIRSRQSDDGALCLFFWIHWNVTTHQSLVGHAFIIITIIIISSSSFYTDTAMKPYNTLHMSNTSGKFLTVT